MRNRLLVVVFSLMFTACSVVAAASGSKEPNLERVKVGSSRSIVEQELGLPIETKDNGRILSATYVYKIGDEPAPGRAALYLVGDIFTLFFAEYIFFPLEISNSGNAHELMVNYNRNDQVVGVKKSRKEES